MARGRASGSKSLRKMKNVGLLVALSVAVVIGYKYLNTKSPEQIEFEQAVAESPLEGKVIEFPIEGSEHVPSEAEVVYKTNPPTSGDHLAEAEDWGVYTEEVSDKMAVHGLEHGGIWISYINIDESQITILREIGKENAGSVIVAPRSKNDTNIAIASWGRMMKLESVDKALIQKYIDTYKNQSPEKLAI